MRKESPHAARRPQSRPGAALSIFRPRRFTLRLLPLMAAVLTVAGLQAGETPGRADAIQVGDWALYRIMGMDTLLQRHTVKAIEGEGEDAAVVFEVINLVDGKETGREESKKTIRTLRREDAETARNSVRKETVAVKEREIAVDVTVQKDGDKEFIFQTSPEIPASGVVSMTQRGQSIPIAELIDFGKGR